MLVDLEEMPCNKIPIYPIFYLLRGDRTNPGLRGEFVGLIWRSSQPCPLLTELLPTARGYTGIMEKQMESTIV